MTVTRVVDLVAGPGGAELHIDGLPMRWYARRLDDDSGRARVRLLARTDARRGGVHGRRGRRRRPVASAARGWLRQARGSRCRHRCCDRFLRERLRARLPDLAWIHGGSEQLSIPAVLAGGDRPDQAAQPRGIRGAPFAIQRRCRPRRGHRAARRERPSKIREHRFHAVRGGCWFERDALKLHLGVDADFRPARKAHPALIVDDVRGLAQAVAAAGGEVVDDEPLDGYDRVYVHDPFGNRIELMQPRHRA